jgi:hypothetical protein
VKSIVSYPDRGPYGDSNWRGNTSGRLIKDLLLYFRPTLCCDPMQGSGTTGDVCKELGIRYVGLDLHSGFNIIKDSVIEKIKESPDYFFVHPPYHDIIKYSGSVWGNKPHPDDLSHCHSPEEFLDKLQLALYNVYDSLAGNGHYSVLIGDIRRRNNFWSIQADIIKMGPGVLESVVIKEQHNCLSDKIAYTGRFVPIVHEYLLNFKKDRLVFGFLDAAVKTSQGLVALSNATWKAVVEWTLRKLSGKANLSEIYSAVAEKAQEKIKANPNWQAKVRQVLQKYASNVEWGVWAIRNAA